MGYLCLFLAILKNVSDRMLRAFKRLKKSQPYILTLAVSVLIVDELIEIALPLNLYIFQSKKAILKNIWG